MENSEAVSGESGHRPTAASGAEDVTYGVATATLGWLILTLLWATEPLRGLTFDLTAVRVTAMHVCFFLGVATPVIALLALVTYRNWKAGRRLRFPLPGSARPAMGPGIVTLVAVAWLAVTLLLWSEPGYELMSLLLWLGFTGCLAVVWLGVLVPNAYRTWKAHGLRKAATTLSYLVPLPLAAVALFIVIPDNATFNVRFELSEAALTRHVQQYERTGHADMEFVGLYAVDEAYRRDGCIILQTNIGFSSIAGLAYCTGILPDGELDHIKGRWWRYQLTTSDSD